MSDPILRARMNVNETLRGLRRAVLGTGPIRTDPTEDAAACESGARAWELVKQFATLTPEMHKPPVSQMIQQARSLVTGQEEA